MPTPRKVVVAGSRSYLKLSQMEVGQCVEGIYLGRAYSEEWKQWTYHVFTKDREHVYINGTDKVNALFETAGIPLNSDATDGEPSYIWLTKTREVPSKIAGRNPFVDVDLEVGEIDDDESSALLAESRIVAGENSDDLPF
jgi:hypothetical protein